ncbi:MAG: glycosyltransferase family 2 protein [Gammaproteobacteria bacterium]|nr:glycosyltransferase family 2 protein [Gammaproteobacteria bacterium]
METIFWFSLLLLIYPYFVYPGVIWFWGAIAGKRVMRRESQPTVTVIIPAYNEARHIEATLLNKLEQLYPQEKLDVIVVSDESTDGTDDIVTMHVGSRVQLLRQQPRAGKAAGLNKAVAHAKGEIVVFSDGNTLFEKDSIAKMVENFADPSVGYVTGSMGFLDAHGSAVGAGISAYMRYENALRELETRFWSIVGSNGGVDAIRKNLYRDIPPDQITDFVLPLHVNSTGHRVVYDERVLAWEHPNEAMGSEFRMRVRVALRALRGMYYMRALLNPFKNGRLSFSLLSHKAMRYMAPFFMLSAFLSNLVIVGDSFVYTLLLIAQIGCYGLGVLGMRGIRLPVFGTLSRLAAYFVLTNAAFAVAVVKWMRGEKVTVWKPRAG